jgi:hypothetical protein
MKNLCDNNNQQRKQTKILLRYSLGPEFYNVEASLGHDLIRLRAATTVFTSYIRG